ncbi:uncharacterized protein RJT20DRAFT_35948 [Scheffersomyces xylosifermentans]|uniref:uncharacterized protein n=1 Tax=Scheffersomyces xylosifermentans TaxID=1304137 RepID=UPI00315CE922
MSSVEKEGTEGVSVLAQDSAPFSGKAIAVENKGISATPESPVEHQVNSTENGTPNSHNYSTRLKERQHVEELQKKSELKQKQHNVVIHPRLKAVPFKGSDLTAPHSHIVINQVAENNGIMFYQSDENPHNRRGFKYKPCRPNPWFPSNLYSTTEIAPFIVRPSYFDRSSGIVHSEDMSLISAPKGWRSARTNVGIREGKYFFEFNIVSANEDNSRCHVRIGLARKEAALEAPVGFDGYSYGLRDVTGEFITLSRPKEEFVEGGFKSGDTIGFLVEFPTLNIQKTAVDEFVKSKRDLIKASEQSSATKDESQRKRRKTKKGEVVDNSKFYAENNILRDQIPIRYKNALYYEQYEYTNTKIMDHLLNPVTIFGEKAVLEKNDKESESDVVPIIPDSRIRIFKNGIEQSRRIENLFSFLPTDIENEELNISPNTKQQQNPNYRNTDDGSLGYYPMLSVFQNGIVGINAGPDFRFPINEDGVKPLSDRYNESVVEEWYWDLIDEVEAEYLDSFEIQE